MLQRSLRVLGIALAALAMPSCATSLREFADNRLTVADLSSRNMALAAMRASTVAGARIQGFAGGCAASTLTIARKRGDEYVFQYDARTSGLGGHDIVQLEIPPGQYHVVSWSCIEPGPDGKLVKTVLGAPESVSFALERLYKKSFASFTLGPGEIVNVGSLNLIIVKPGVVHVHVSDMPDDIFANFKREWPKVSSQMITRLMTIDHPPLPADQLAAACAKIASINAAYRMPPPADCSAASAKVAR